MFSFWESCTRCRRGREQLAPAAYSGGHKIERGSLRGLIGRKGGCSPVLLHQKPPVDNAAGKLDFTGTADSVEMDSTSGSAKIEGDVTEQIRIDMVTGDIHVVTADPTVTAGGRTIEYNGQRMGGDSWSRQGNGCTLDLKTALGTISIRNP